MVRFNSFFAFVLGIVIFLLIRFFRRYRERPVSKSEKEFFIPRAYTIEELAEYDGVRKPYAFMGIKGVIYNVALEWYGPDAPYHVFAGRDSSRALGKFKVDQSEANADWTRLSPSHMKSLDDWEEKLRFKYPVVGWINDPNGDFVKRSQDFEP
ncbi:unnamed protein product [Phytomonas sp. Hart1]|nr:unnamed protein product [Phytomonas sp. Hart1]|eukprot:CCW72048.1 unnamed protein product [Phytomonas sp. isolate Hart1]